MTAQVEDLRTALADRFLIERELGHGGMATVYLAQDLTHDRAVALKVLRPEIASAVGVDRFLQEIQIEVALQHPYVLPVHDWGQAVGLPYYVMPYVAGESLRTRLERERQLPVRDAVGIARDVAEALAHAHRRGYVHRDIKPENILLSGSHAIVADFGIARAISAAGGARLTQTGVSVGTPAYMSPEQAGADSIDGRSDVYSLGCVLYEMLAGEPPFTGRTAQAIIARHMHDPPHSLTVVRPQLPGKLVRVVETCLAKVPADRFGGAEELYDALADAAEGPPADRMLRRPSLTRRALVATMGVAAAAAAWYSWPGRVGEPDPNKVVVFPLRDAQDAGLGEDVATYIGHVLDGTAPLRWIDGSDWLRVEQRSQSLPWEEAERLSRAKGARYVIDGAILRQPDSTTVVLRLHDILGDSLVRRSGRTGPAGSSEARLGALAVGDLLLAIVEPGRTIDVAPLSDRAPAAIAHFLQGERAFRMGRFTTALEHYGAAIDDDSLFALAAVRGGQAANWLERPEDAERLTGVALRHDSLLPPRYRYFARGSQLYLEGRADSAVNQLRRSVELAPEWSEGWATLGEAYYHLLPSVPGSDSLAEAAFHSAVQYDSTLIPALYHLAEIELRRSEVALAERRYRQLRAASADSMVALPLGLALRCARDGPRRMDWERMSNGQHGSVLETAKTLTTVPELGACAESALRFLLGIDSLAPAQSFAALFGLNCLLMRERKYDQIRELIASPVGSRFRSDPFYLFDAAAGAPFGVEATRVAEGMGTDFRSMRSLQLWLLGVWESQRGRSERVDTIARLLSARADSTGQGQDRFLAEVVGAHALLAAGNEDSALQRLAGLEPIARRNELAWTLPDALGLERLTAARLYLAQGRPAEAIASASQLDSPQPIAYLLYARAGLQVRIEAAAALGDAALAARYRTRLRALDAGPDFAAVVHQRPPRSRRTNGQT